MSEYAMDEPEWMRVAEIANKFGISRSTIYRLMAKGVFDTRKPSPQIRLVSLASVRRWLAEAKR